MKNWEIQFEEKIRTLATNADPAHDLLHFKRVVAMTKKLSLLENADLNISIPAAWLHDFVIVPKDSPLRSQASKMSADAAMEYLSEIDYPEKYFKDIHHAIAGHSFTAELKVLTLESKIIQDADRLDGLGAIGIARCFATSGLLKRIFYSEDDPFCITREPDDSVYGLDHFYKKLFLVAEKLNTGSARAEGFARVQFMKNYLEQLEKEI